MRFTARVARQRRGKQFGLVTGALSALVVGAFVLSGCAAGASPTAVGTSTVRVPAQSQPQTTNGDSTSTSPSPAGTPVPKGPVTASIQPGDGWTVGVGMPVVVNLSRSVSTKNRAAVEKALTVTSTGDVRGGWHWMTSQQVQWRPASYWPAHTKVHVSADLAGVAIRPGAWGSTRKRTSDFSIGSAMISTVDVAAHTMTVTRDGKVLRVIPVTTGKAGMATRNGIKVIMSRETTHRMDSSTVGISKSDPGYYNLVVKYAMRLTYSGEFVHAAPWSTGSQGHANVSHGCTGMTTADAKWLFGKSKVGDVVSYQNSTRKLEWGNGYTAWNESFSEWTA
jgi:lipoprotein-anchoring transpeptidase ErfK/SrfK